jgi:transposase
MVLDVQEWLEKHSIWMLEWPPFSPDLNPIEHLWYHLKRKIIKLYPHLETIGGLKEDLG